ncbi:hypothetical protein RHO95_25800, partial [Salmonella enterica subsp. enterica serovar Typhimurium]|nr:hypothetical protein [Salmonella enterica subsp. enterica serovar Typhimurium]
RRSRTTERSESVSEEAEERLMRYFLLTHLCGISHRIGSWLRPDTRQHPLTRPDGLVCSRHPLTDKL